MLDAVAFHFCGHGDQEITELSRSTLIQTTRNFSDEFAKLQNQQEKLWLLFLMVLSITLAFVSVGGHGVAPVVSKRIEHLFQLYKNSFKFIAH